MQLASKFFFTISNMISLCRLVMAVPIVWLLLHEQYTTAFWVCVIAAWTDWLDGVVARRTHTVSEWGKVLDPIADKVIVGSVVIILVLNGLLPLWFVISVVGRDLLILLGGMIAVRYATEVPPSLWSGKLAVTAISLAGLLAMLEYRDARDIFIILSTALMLLSLWDYSKRLYGIVRQTQENT